MRMHVRVHVRAATGDAARIQESRSLLLPICCLRRARVRRAVDMTHAAPLQPHRHDACRNNNNNNSDIIIGSEAGSLHTTCQDSRSRREGASSLLLDFKDKHK